MRTLALDIGRNKTGVAISESSMGIVTPLRPLIFKLEESPYEWFDMLSRILGGRGISQNEIDTVVIGHWKDSHYRNLEMKKLVKIVREVISMRSSWKVALVRETFTSMESREILKIMGVSNKRIQRSVDSYAASLILIDYLEMHRSRMERNK